MPNIIGGKYKKTILDVPNKLVRPTSAFKREAIFSILESYAIKHSIEIYKKKSIIDIFAGSGLVGLEAISRGMDMAYFIENNDNVIKILEKNCQKICKKNKFEIITGNAINSLDGEFIIKPSIIFIDPPYKKENINLLLLKILKNKIKSEYTFIIIETSKEEKITIPEGLTLFREKVYGKTKILFLN
ncbi:16S rRNA (guanine(966)-N(2))-methyltransferase RsmD [Alphaproteobacteria bacterium]|nr:16S rRNA (guanine(966)-N(2))-methyltransferase RsmD [Alphaproteobacteria bacterium]